MTELCPDCDAPMMPADEIDSEKANNICPACAPDFVLAHGTSYSSKERTQYGR